MTRLVRWRLAAVAANVLLAGCGSSTTLRTYVLGDPVPVSGGISSEAGQPTVELRSVTVPDYLDSSDILRRTGPNELTASPTGRWGERLSQGLTHALAEALSSRLPGIVISTNAVFRPTRLLFVDVERFEIAADGSCVIVARWRATSANAQTILQSERGTFIEHARSDSDSAVAAALTGDVAQIAERMAPMIRDTIRPAP